MNLFLCENHFSLPQSSRLDDDTSLIEYPSFDQLFTIIQDGSLITINLKLFPDEIVYLLATLVILQQFVICLIRDCFCFVWQ